MNQSWNWGVFCSDSNAIFIEKKTQVWQKICEWHNWQVWVTLSVDWRAANVIRWPASPRSCLVRTHRERGETWKYTNHTDHPDFSIQKTPAVFLSIIASLNVSRHKDVMREWFTPLIRDRRGSRERSAWALAVTSSQAFTDLENVYRRYTRCNNTNSRRYDSGWRWVL